MVEKINQIYTRKLQHSIIVCCHKKIRLNVFSAERQKCTLLGDYYMFPWWTDDSWRDLQGVSTAPTLHSWVFQCYSINLLTRAIELVPGHNSSWKAKPEFRAAQEYFLLIQLLRLPPPPQKPTQLPSSSSSVVGRCIKQTKNLQWCFRLS